jgi:NPCBM/NEW2 domain-containing protein
VSSTSAPPQGTGSEDQGSVLATYKKFKDLFDALPVYMKAVAALLTALAAVITAVGGWFAVDRASNGPQAQPTVYATVTVTMPGALPSSLSPEGGTSPPVSLAAAPSPAAGTDLSAIPPVNTSFRTYTTASPQPIGTSTYSDGIRFSCTSGSDSDSYYGYNSVTYNVAGYKTLTATIGVPPDATNAGGNSATIQFHKDGTATQLHLPVTVALDSPQTVQVQLQGASQLQINCTAANADGTNGEDIDVVIGDATLSP